MKCLTFLVIFFLAGQAYAATKEYIRDHEYIATEYDSKYTSRINALNGVKQDLIEEIGTYIKSIVNISEDDFGNKYASHDVVTLAAGITSMTVLEEGWNRIRYFVKAKMLADPDDVLKQVAAIRNNHEIEEQLQETVDDLKDARDQISKLKKQLAIAVRNSKTSTKNNIQAPNKMYLETLRDVEVDHVYQEAMKILLFEDDFNKAFIMMKKLADQDYAKAQTKIGLMYERGMGVDKNYKQAMEWYEKAVQSGHAGAYARIGFLYERGLGVTTDYAMAVKYYRKAIEQGSDRAKALLGWLHQSGSGVENDLQKAFKLTEESISREPSGFCLAQMGFFYERGIYVDQDLAKARDYYEQASQKGNALGMSRLGFMYFKGRGADVDYARALELARRSDQKGSGPGMGLLVHIYEVGAGVDRDLERARVQYEKAVQFGSAHAMVRLGRMYFKGTGVKQDWDRARELFEMAKAKGHPKAEQLLVKLDRKRGF